MSVQLDVKIKNIDEIKAAFQAAPAKMASELILAVQRIVLKIESSAKKNAPVKTGMLRQSIRARLIGTGARGQVSADTNYAAMVHEGQKPHIISVVRKKVLADKRTGAIFGKRVRHPGAKGQPFLKQALEENEGFINDQMEKAVKNALS